MVSPYLIFASDQHGADETAAWLPRCERSSWHRLPAGAVDDDVEEDGGDDDDVEDDDAVAKDDVEDAQHITSASHFQTSKDVVVQEGDNVTLTCRWWLVRCSRTTCLGRGICLVGSSNLLPSMSAIGSSGLVRISSTIASDKRNTTREIWSEKCESNMIPWK